VISAGVFTRQRRGMSLHGIVADSRQRTIAGTLSYVSPEMIQGQPYGRAVDAWVSVSSGPSLL
jgi:serine/threonine protein kinase